MELETQLLDVPQTTIDDLFESDAPSKTPSAEDLIGTKKPEDKEDVKEPAKPKEREQKIEDKTIDDLFESDEKPAVEEKKTPKEKKEPKSAVPEVDYKSLYDYYVESGKWTAVDEESLKDVEWNEETFQQMLDYQWENQLGEGLNQLVDSTGPYGKAIISYVQNGGNPEEIIELFKEQKKLELADITTDNGQKEVISNYYKSLGWNDQKVSKHLQRLEVEGEESLKEEAEEVKSLHDNSIKEQVEAKNQAQQEYAKQEADKEVKFKANIVNTLKKRNDLTPQEKQEIHRGLLNYDKKLPNGNVVNQFYIDFQNFISDPNRYVELYQFIKDKDAFLKKLDTKAESKATTKSWKFIKNGGALSNKASVFVEPEDNKEDFKFNYK